MHLLNTLLVIITGVATSAALVLDKHIPIEEPKGPKEAIALEPIIVHPVGAAVAFQDCGSVDTVSEVRLTGCTSTSCSIPAGKNLTLEIDYTLKEDLDGAKYILNHIFDFAEVQYVNKDVAVTGDAGQVTTASISFRAGVPIYGPSKLKGQVVVNNQILACVVVQADVTSNMVPHEPITADPAGGTPEVVAHEPSPVEPTDGLEFYDCGSSGDVNAVRITGCTTDPCELPTDTDLTLEIDYTPQGYIRGLTYSLYIGNQYGGLTLVNETVAIRGEGYQIYTASMSFNWRWSKLFYITAKVIGRYRWACVDIRANFTSPSPLTVQEAEL